MVAPIDISVAIPCFNEAENVAAIVAAVKAELVKAAVSYEIIVIDNASTDATATIARKLCVADPFVRLIINNRNYGQMRSPVHGVFQTLGAAAICLSADFQDPPDLIGAFIARWRAGAKIVLGVYQSGEASALMRAIRSSRLCVLRAVR